MGSKKGNKKMTNLVFCFVLFLMKWLEKILLDTKILINLINGNFKERTPA